MKILVGLGNPGDKYEMNRHNVGFMAVEAIAENHSSEPWKRRFQGMTCEVEIGREKVLLLKPTTFMNESGRSVGEAIRFYKISPADVIVFHDELDLEPGKVRVKFGGGHAGHNGLKSISAHIGNDYHRVRIGIGHPGSREAVVAYVLHDFSKKDREWLEPLLHGMARGTGLLLAGQEAKFLNEVARIVRPVVEPPAMPLRKEATGPVTIKPLVLKELGAPGAESAKPETAPAASATLAAPASKPKAAATASGPAATSPAAAPQPTERKPALAEAGAASRGADADRNAEPAQTESLAAKLKAWFSRK